MLLQKQSEILHELNTSLNQNDICMLIAPHGSGKTLISQSISFKNIYISFDMSEKERIGLTTIQTLIGAYANKISIRDDGKSFMDLLPKWISLPMIVIVECIDSKRRILRKFNNYFNEEELNIVLRLLEIIQETTVLIIDNVSNCNKESIQFIEKITSPKVITSIFNDKLKFLFLDTVKNANMIYIETRTNKFKIIAFDLDTYSYFQYLTLKSREIFLNEKTKEVLMNITCKDINKTNIIFSILSKYSLDLDSCLSNKESSEKLTELFNEIIETNINLDEDDISLMEVASVIGLLFSIYEVGKLTEQDIDLIRNRINKLFHTGFIKISHSDYYEFMHEVIRKLFYNKLTNKAIYHSKYAKFLKTSQPLQYKLIAQNFFLSGDKESSEREIIISEAMNTIKNRYISIYSNDENYIFNKTFFNDIKIVFTFYKDKRFLECLNYLNEMISITSRFHQAIVNYMKSRCMILVCEDSVSFKNAAEIMEIAIKNFKENNDFEIYVDSLTVLINIYAYKLSDIETAKVLENDYCKVIENININEVQLIHEEFQRRTASLLSPISAKGRILKLINRKFDLTILEEYKLYNDAVAYCLYAGDFEEAQKCLNLLAQHTMKNSFYDFPEKYKPDNNKVLLNLLINVDNIVKFKNAIETGLEILGSYCKQKYTSHIVELNYSSLLILNGDFEESFQILKYLEEHLQRYNNALYLTCINSNLSWLYFLKGNYTNAEKYNRYAKDALQLWHPQYRMYYEKQNECVRNLIKNKASYYNSYSSLDLLDDHYLYNTYKFVVRGLLLSELLFYTL